MSETCYGHSSSNAVVLPDYAPSSPQAGSISLCCEIGHNCLTNGLCVTQSGVYYNGGCTDSTYEAAVCPKFCTSGDNTGCGTASNGPGLVTPVSSAQAVSATGTSNVPASLSSDTTSSSSAGFSKPTSFPHTNTATTRFGMPPMPIEMLYAMIGVVGCAVVCALFYFSSWTWIKRQCQRLCPCRIPFLQRRAVINDNDDNMELYNIRDRSRNESDSQASEEHGTIPTEVEGLEANPAETAAGRTPIAPAPSPGPHDIAPDNNPLVESPRTAGSISTAVSTSTDGMGSTSDRVSRRLST